MRGFLAMCLVSKAVNSTRTESSVQASLTTSAFRLLCERRRLNSAMVQAWSPCTLDSTSLQQHSSVSPDSPPGMRT